LKILRFLPGKVVKKCKRKNVYLSLKSFRFLQKGRWEGSKNVTKKCKKLSSKSLRFLEKRERGKKFKKFSFKSLRYLQKGWDLKNVNILLLKSLRFLQQKRGDSKNVTSCLWNPWNFSKERAVQKCEDKIPRVLLWVSQDFSKKRGSNNVKKEVKYFPLKS